MVLAEYGDHDFMTECSLYSSLVGWETNARIFKGVSAFNLLLDVVEFIDLRWTSQNKKIINSLQQTEDNYKDSGG